jgi:hypothetical protein
MFSFNFFFFFFFSLSYRDFNARFFMTIDSVLTDVENLRYLLHVIEYTQKNI